MSIFKCKMCGGALEINNNESVAVCQYCGTKQTLPRLDDEKKANLYDRANHFRRNNDYDKAMGIYETILNEDTTDAEAYWSILLCKYGIEYVEDPVSQKRIPTINRSQYSSIYADENYKLAVQYADPFQKTVYEEEAKVIEEIQKGILDISSKESPFDIFICYKETDDKGRRTSDSVLATELYYELTNEGYKVFFSKITLEDKLGEEYEPYIFAALNSAKVMIVLGTKPEYFNAVWVKNEWSRFLALIKNGEKKMLIPAYHNMDPYALPEEFSHLQAQDMSKLGFMQDIVRGVKKVLGESSEEKAEIVNKSFANADFNVSTAIDGALLLIEDGEKKSAQELLDKAFSVEPRNPLIYVGRLLIERNVKTQDGLQGCYEPLENSSNYQKAVRFADPTLRAALEECNETIKTRNKETVYTNAVNEINNATTSENYLRAKSLLKQIPEYKDSSELISLCDEKINYCNNEAVYIQATDLLAKDINNPNLQKENAQSAISLLTPIKDFKDAEDKIDEANRKIYECEKRITEKKEKRRIIVGIFFFLTVFAAAAVLIFSLIIIPSENYKEAEDLFGKAAYSAAYEIYAKLGNYEDAAEKAKECLYIQATALREEENWDEANALFEQIKDYKDSADLIHQHIYEVIASEEASCEKAGYRDYKCSACGNTYREDFEATGHDFSEATCVSPQTCTICGKTSGSALGHTTDGVKCSRCGTITFKTITYSGKGSEVKRDINLPEGNFRITCTMTSGDANMTMYFNYGNSNKYGNWADLIFNEYTAGTSEVTVISGPVSNGSITINAGKSWSGATMGWKITIEAIG